MLTLSFPTTQVFVGFSIQVGVTTVFTIAYLYFCLISLFRPKNANPQNSVEFDRLDPDSTGTEYERLDPKSTGTEIVRMDPDSTGIDHDRNVTNSNGTENNHQGTNLNHTERDLQGANSNRIKLDRQDEPENPNEPEFEYQDASIRDQGHQEIHARLDKWFMVFWESSIYFNITIVIATIVTFTDDMSMYTVALSGLSCTITSTVTMCLWYWYERQCSTFVLICVCMAVNISSSFAGASLFVYDKPQRIAASTNFDNLCLRPLPSMMFITRPTVFAIAAGLGPAFILSSIALRSTLRMGWVIYYKAARVAVAALTVVAFALMWMCLATFILIRHELSAIVNDDQFADNEWGFGQILAVVAWLPVFISFIHLFGKPAFFLPYSFLCREQIQTRIYLTLLPHA